MPGGGQGRGKPAREPAPSARPELPREFIAAHKRRRIMDAIAELTAEEGYDATKIGDIVRRAGVARKTLYDNFEGKEEVFLSAFDAAVEESIEQVEAACASVGEEEWEERLRSGLSAFLRYVAEHPAVARMCLIEALSATAAATHRYEAAMQRYVDLTRAATPDGDLLPETIDETLVGGVAWIVYQQIRRDKADLAEDLLPELFEFMLTPFQAASSAAGRRRRNA